ncbi:hypothetical protein PY092_14400 [Muricauda sp. 334s03]|uniref:Uncharacterized protein n=1 Tax=Flagellimonas yonaguniensis TaxID=3031325 RepID=A0ABT5Y215_9FLAO|nr:hypothetical protein [[Muricauda] yonaguniensis]MDF0717351.1 hypothetical protein [[Muricauda] yonaguniensis]
MKRFDLCIVINNIDYNNAFAIILDIDYDDFYHVEIWDFDKHDGAIIDYVNVKNLRLATSKEIKEYQKRFKKYSEKYEKRK